MKEAKSESPIWDIIIVGGGPSGAAAALETVGSKLKVALMDKAKFPRDKICGDALSPDVVNQLKKMNAGLYERFYAASFKQPIRGITAISPKKVEFELRLSDKEGYVVSRLDFDSFMMGEVKRHPEIEVWEETELLSAQSVGQYVRIETNKGIFTTKMVIGADGNHSMVAKLLGGRQSLDRKHHCAALRQYYENVDWPKGKEHIELHFFDDVIPGYLWVFPMSENRANVGIGMPSDEVSDRKINLKKLLDNHLSTDPELKERFKNARPLESIKGFGIPLGSKRYKISGKNYMLVGDAACLVDPLTGEGIANSIRSGRFSGKHAIQALQLGRFDAAFMEQYDKKIYSMMGDEFRLSRFIQRSFRSKRVLNFTIWLGSKSRIYRRLLHLLFDETKFFSEWGKPAYYLSLFKAKGK